METPRIEILSREIRILLSAVEGLNEPMDRARVRAQVADLAADRRQAMAALWTQIAKARHAADRAVRSTRRAAGVL